MKPLRPGLLPVIALVVVVVWALFAVGTLTATLLAAQKIDNRVVAINQTYPQVAQDTQSIPLAFETGKIAGQINDAVKPIGPQFTQVVDAVHSIDSSVTSVGGAVGSINSAVHEINTSVHSIDSSVTKIDTGLTKVGDDVDEINDSAKGIKHKFDGILDDVNDITDRVHRIDHQVEDVIEAAKGIRSDLDAAIPVVGDIDKNAAAIKNSPLIQLRITEIPSALVTALLNFLTSHNLPLPVSMANLGIKAAQPAPVAAPLPVPGAQAPALAPQAPADADKSADAPADQKPADSAPNGGGLFGSLSKWFG